MPSSLRSSLLFLSFLGISVWSWSTSPTRRQWLQQSVAAIAGAGLSTVSPAFADDVTMEEVYFGVGCFWHIQHEFVQAERDLLQRGDAQLTSRTGYAGGKDNKPICYHNLAGIGDYGRLGHGEVVGMSLPSDKIVDFSKVYFSLFDPRTKDRVDPQDRGLEYRSLLGLPGGTQHSSYPQIQQAAKEAGFTLKEGKGSDPDTLRSQTVWVYDTRQFPFYQAEVYHQFHNDFQSPAYGKAYNNLANLALEDGRISTTGCPDRV